MSRFTKWLVVYHGRVVDEVYYLNSVSADEVRRSLIEHDGFPSGITVHWR